MEDCGSHLKKWHKEVYLSSQNRLGWLLRRLKKVRKMAPTAAVIEECRQVEHDIRQLRQQQETAAWQRCRPFVLRDGDKNTSYFHMKALNRLKRNRLKGLEDEKGFKHRTIEGMKAVVHGYFSNLYKSAWPEITIDDVSFIEKNLSEDMIDFLSRPFCHVEIEDALADMHPCKSPGPDGFPALFHKKYWDLVGNDVCRIVLDPKR